MVGGLEGVMGVRQVEVGGMAVGGWTMAALELNCLDLVSGEEGLVVESQGTRLH